ncbi:hypothetical protein LL998_22645 [Burkholderia ambifaria]|uniref:hypothetical protein n=1 Tax=Burkholderia ambifaria TaxID=152480 RepID=UPI001E437217|nr:hypothetical protein [Burkholderia ambifaria]UEP36469.1 hypothetical protein LL998_22645 [Burkholderia ambifaria]
MDAHVEPRRDDAQIVRKHGAAAHAQLSGYSQGQLDRAGGVGWIRIRTSIASRENVSDETSSAGAAAFDGAANPVAARGTQPSEAMGHRRHTGVAPCRRSVDRNMQPVSTRRYVTSLKHFIRPGPDARSIATARGVWIPSSISHASQPRRDAMTATAPRVDIARHSDRAAGTKPAFALLRQPRHRTART